jgi:hypothetical protein
LADFWASLPGFGGEAPAVGQAVPETVVTHEHNWLRSLLGGRVAYDCCDCGTRRVGPAGASVGDLPDAPPMLGPRNALIDASRIDITAFL